MYDKSLKSDCKFQKLNGHDDKNLEKTDRNDNKLQLDKNQNPDYNNIINPKILNNLKNHSHSKRGSILRSPMRGSAEISEVKIIEEVLAVLKHSSNRVTSEGQIILNLNIKPFVSVLLNDLDCLLHDNNDIFNLDMDSLGNSLFLLMNYFFKTYNWDSLKIPESKFMNLVYNIQKNYNDNPYHNSIHAADTVNTCYYILEKLEVAKITNFTNLEKLILLLSAAAHDIDHPGNNNLFEINSRSLLALTYNDKSVLENYHLFLFFNFLNNDNMNIFCQFDLEEVKSLRKMFINNIIATDISNHKQDMKKLQEIANKYENSQENKETILYKKENKDFIITQLIHFADISNCTKPFNIYQKWVDKLFTEFFQQGDKEKELGLPVSMLCDRDKTVIPDTQVFFINAYLVDFTKTFETLYPKFQRFSEVLEINKKMWEDKKKEPYVIDS